MSDESYGLLGDPRGYTGLLGDPPGRQTLADALAGKGLLGFGMAPQQGLLGQIAHALMAPSRVMDQGFDFITNYSPHTRDAAKKAGQIAGLLAETVGPGADMVGAKETSAETVDALRRRDLVAALSNAGQTAAAVPMMFLPGTIAGVKSAIADLTGLARAEDMARVGASRESIWGETGWFQGPDQKWRFEIDDSGAKALKNAKDTGFTPLAEWIRHEELRQAYPDLFGQGSTAFRGLEAAADGRMKNGASFDSSRGTIRVSGNVKGQERTSATLHEIQHAIQELEDFARGSHANAGMGEYGLDQYRRAAGEVEARAVQARMNLTPEQRAARPPWLDYDVPEDRMVFRHK